MTESARPWWDDPDLQRARLRRQVQLMTEARDDLVVDTGDSDDYADMNHMYRGETILVRDADLNRVSDAVPGDVEDSLINGLNLYRLRDTDTATALATIEDRLGVGVATPDHVVHVCPTAGACPATEPETVDTAEPFPAVNTNPDTDGSGVRVSVVDTGFLPGVAGAHAWLAEVTGDVEDYDPDDIGPYVGHGTFIAGVVRAMAPNAEVRVEGYRTHGGTIYESQMIKQLDEALDRVPDVISLSGGTRTRRNLGLLGFEVFWESRLQFYKGTVLVAAAGNDGDRGPFWPAAFPWAVSVGALDPDDRRAPFTNIGSWVDVYAPGMDIVNAFPTGTYTYREPPNDGKVARFTNGLARWSGTSFATPIVAGLIAARMSATGESGRRAADALLAQARCDAIPRVGPILKPPDPSSART